VRGNLYGVSVALPGFRSDGVEEFALSSGERVSVVKLLGTFARWEGEPQLDTYGGKPLVTWRGTPLFAELAVLRGLEEAGWTGVWADSFGRCFRTASRESPPVTLPEKAQRLYSAIERQSSARAGGCWDVFAWRSGDVAFVELKRSGRDKIRDSQRAWLEAALSIGVPITSFAVIEWSIA
jgi:hypothetical protein